MLALDLTNCTFALVDELRLPLVNSFYAECKYKVKCGRQDRVYSFTYNGKIIAAARLLLQKSGVYLLRNLCVLPECRKQGVASCFLKNVLNDLSPQHCYCYALSHLKDFYLSLGFSVLTIDQVPQDIGETHARNQSRNRDWILMGYIQEDAITHL